MHFREIPLRSTYHIIRHSTSAYANRNPTFLNQIQPPEPSPTGKAILCLPCARPLLTPLQPRTHVMYSGTRYKPPLWGPRATVYLLTAFRPLPVVLLPECIRVEECGSCLPWICVFEWYVREMCISLDISSRNRNIT